MKIQEFPLIEQVIKKYESQDYAGAYHELALVKDKIPLTEYYYNGSVIKFKMGHLSESRLLLERSISSGNIGVEARHNLGVLKSSLNVAELESGMTSPWIHTNYLFYSVILLIILGLLIVCRKNKKIFLIIGVSIFALSISLRAYFFRGEIAIVADGANIYEGPSDIFKTDQVFPTGLKVLVKNQQSGWVFIRYPERYAGWVLLKNLYKLEEK